MAITLGLVEAVDSNGVYVSMPGSRGVLRGPYLTLQDVAVGDRVLTVTTDDGETVIVGLASAAAPRSTPATSTDNTVPRFDGTGGALQTSGVTIEDDSRIRIVGTAAGYLIIGNAGSGDASAIECHTGDGSTTASRRWWFGKGQAAESGSNAGSDFFISRYDDSGGGLGSAVTIQRSTGKVTLGSVGSTAGLEFGSSGPRQMVGTGGPSGISAPVGSTWRQTNANTSHGSLTGLLWNKVGTGTTEGTDWLVDYEGRWIDWTPTLTNITRGTGYSQRNKFTRSGKSITFDFALHFGTGGSVTADPSITLPVSAVATQEHLFPALLRTTSTYSLGIGYYITGALTFFAVGTAGSLLGDIASVTTLAGSWASTGRIQVTGTYEIA